MSVCLLYKLPHLDHIDQWFSNWFHGTLGLRKGISRVTQNIDGNLGILYVFVHIFSYFT
jgi:hypothetical protein